jgi:diguanylate cyclase
MSLLRTLAQITLIVVISCLLTTAVFASPVLLWNEGVYDAHSEEIKPITPKKYSDILGSKEHPLDAQLVEFLSIIDDSPEKAREIFPRVSAQKHNFNAAENYLFYLSQAKMSLQQKAYNKVLNWAEQALSLTDKIAAKQLNTPLFAQIYLVLADSYAGIAEYEKAYEQKKLYLEKYREYRLSIREQRLDKLNQKYETDIKVKRTQLLETQNRLKALSLKDTEEEKRSQQRNLVLLAITTIFFIVLLLRQINIRSKLKVLAQTDTLTGLYNRRTLFEKGQSIVESAKQTNGDLSVLILDIDEFKAINDNYSHQIGDIVIAEVAELGNEAMRSNDILARIGGEEFAAVLPGASIDEAKAIAERLREKVEHLIIKQSRSLRVTVSVGVANIHQVTPNIDVLLAAADQALYQAKRKGRNKVCCFK